ncbi:MAG: DNA internalization-related competence protein ComEC/Rec2 [Bacillus sp. (in: firmicutes)]
MKQTIFFFKNRLLYYGVAGLFAVLSVYIHTAIFFLLFLLYITWLKTWRRLSFRSTYMIILLFFVLFLRAESEKRLSHTNIPPLKTNFTIIITDVPMINGDKWSVVGKETTNNEKLILSYKLKTESEKGFYQKQKMIGKTCNVTGALEEPAVARNENGFDYQKYLQNQSIYWQLKVDDLSIKKCSETKPTILMELKKARQAGSNWIEEYFTDNTKAMAIALIFGDRQWIEYEVQTAYQKLGIIHLLAISGSHIIVIVGIIYFLLIRLGATKEKAVTILLLILPMYAVLTGLSPSVNRAVSMSMLILVKRKSKLFASFSSVDILSFVFLLYLFYEPKVLFDVGFLLSFTVCIFLLVSSSMLIQSSSPPIKTLLFTTFISEFSVLPIILFYFYELPTLSLFANIIFIPFYSVIVLPYFLVVFAISLLTPTIISSLLFPIDMLLRLSDNMVQRVSALPFSTVIFGKPSLFLIVLFMIGLPLFFFLYENTLYKRWRLYCIPFILLGMLYMESVYSPFGEVTFIDIGQGDSILIKEPYRKGIYLIDTGGTIVWDQEKWQMKKNPFEVGKDIVVPYLKSKGVSIIDKLILTHGDVDHIGGAMAVLKSLKVKEIVFPDTVMEPSQEEQAILGIANKKGIPITYVKAGQGWTSSNASFDILSPIDRYAENKNASSIVIKGNIGGLNWLFAGDLEEEGEKKLLQKYPMLTVDILKAGHHGSKTSTSAQLLHAIKPKAAVISAGKNNRYGHPHKDVLERLQAENILIWRTDENGAITYKYHQKEGTFSMQLP